MAKSTTSFKQIDLTRALRAVVAAGLPVARVEIDPCGKIVIMTEGRGPIEPASELDKWMARNACQA